MKMFQGRQSSINQLFIINAKCVRCCRAQFFHVIEITFSDRNVWLTSKNCDLMKIIMYCRWAIQRWRSLWENINVEKKENQESLLLLQYCTVIIFRFIANPLSNKTMDKVGKYWRSDIAERKQLENFNARS
jgi:hypothetical protein